MYLKITTNLLKQKENPKKNLLFILKKQKSAFILTVLLNNQLVISTTLGTILQFLKVEGKSTKRSKKGFVVFINTFKKFFSNYKNNKFKKTIFLNFFDFYLLLFFKKFRFIFNNGSRVLLNLNLKTQTKYFKKVRGIKRRITKSKTKMFLKDWSSIKLKPTYLTKL